MKVLCLGNNSTDTDTQTTLLAKKNNHENHGLIIDPSIEIKQGYYHSSVYDLTHSQIIDLLKKFDSLVWLNQPIDHWSHPDAFYLTTKVVDEAKTFIPVTELVEYQGIKFFENLVESNKSFCIFPFIELLVQNGSTTVCCRSNTPITKLKDINDWVKDPKYKSIRDKMIAGELIPEHCSTCYKYEQQGIKSARQQETVEWANRLNLKSLDDLKNINSPVYYEVRPSNVCNIQCRSCGPGSSNLIEKEYIKLGWIDPTTIIEYTNFDFVHFENLKKLYVAGGEPTAMIDLVEFMQKCVDKQHTDFEFLINTNANKLSDRFLNLFGQFSNLQFIVSIDGFLKVNDYVRWLSDWDRTIHNAKKLNEKHKISFNVVVSIYTISRLDQLLEFFDKTFPGCLVHCAFAEFQDDILNPDHFPDKSYLLERLLRIKNFNCYKNDQLLMSFIDGIIEKYKSSPQANIEKLRLFFEFNDALDISRNVRLKDYIPELDKFRSTVLK